jgi:prolyl-tRNA synthetase
MVAANVRVVLDEREGVSPGFKFNDWEMRGVPLRLEIGPKDVQKSSAVLARRDKPGKEGKSFVPQAGLAEAVVQMLDTIQKALYERALNFRESNTANPRDYGEFKSSVEKGFAYSFWCGSGQCEKSIKDETKATLRCIPLEQSGEEGACIYCGKPSKKKAYFAKAY